MDGCCRGLSGGCGLAIQALAAAVAVGELALCSPPPARKPTQPASSGAAPFPAAAAGGDYAAVGAGAADQAADGAAAAAAAATGELSEAAKSTILQQLMACSLVIGEQSQRITDETAEAHAAEIAAIQADDLAAAKSKSATAGGRQRRLGKAVEADIRAGQAASGRLLATAVAGMAGLAAVAAQRSTGATGQQRGSGSASLRPLRAGTDREAMASLLQRSTQLAMVALETAKHMPDLAPELIEVSKSKLHVATLYLKATCMLYGKIGLYCRWCLLKSLTSSQGHPRLSVFSHPANAHHPNAVYMSVLYLVNCPAAGWLRGAGLRGGGGRRPAGRRRGLLARPPHVPAAAGGARGRPPPDSHVPAGDTVNMYV